MLAELDSMEIMCNCCDVYVVSTNYQASILIYVLPLKRIFIKKVKK